MKMWSCCLLGLTVLLLGAMPAHAADEISLSRDGVTWSSSLPGELFSSSMRWVPGDSQSETFYVRNDGPSSAVFTITARSADTDELLSNEDITLRARVGAGTWTDLENGVRSQSLTSQSMDQGEAVRVDVHTTFNPASTNQSQRKVLAPVFSLTFVDSLGSDDGSDDAGRGRLLPETGAQISVWLVVFAGGMLVIGVRLARRRQEVRRG